MKAIYKLALLIAVVICVLIIIYYVGRSSNDTASNTSLAEADHYSQTSDHLDKSFAQRLSEQLNANASKSKGHGAAKNKDRAHADFSNSFSEQGGHQVPANENNPGPADNSLAFAGNQPNFSGDDNRPALTDVYQSDPPSGISKPQTDDSKAETNQDTEKPQTPKQPSYYIVKPGDTLISISREIYGDGSEWRNIVQANPDVNPKKLYVGQKLSTPSLPGPSHPSAGSNQSDSKNTDAQNNKSYVVQSGDSLSSIARQFYKDTGKWKKIYQANRDKIGNDPSYLQAGMKLVIPK